MTVPVSVLVYLMVFRIAVVGVGLVSLILGYKLFLRGSPMPSNNAEINSSLPGLRIIVKNAAPGTAFALFGAGLILAMVLRDTPAVTVDWLKQASSVTNSMGSDSALIGESIQMRGSGEAGLTSLAREAENLERQGDKVGAQAKAHAAVMEIADPINDLAWSYYEAGREKEALDIATLAVKLVPDNPAYADTLARIRASLVLSPDGAKAAK